jgi:hypothetical protein
MKYAALIYSDQTAWSELSPEEAARERAASMPGWLAVFEEIAKADPEGNGRGCELDAASEAKVVRIRDGERLVTDGPFPGTKEQLGGLFVIDLPDLDEAIRIAALIPASEYGSVEIRPLVVR